VHAGRRLLTFAVPAAVCWVALGELVDLVVGPVRAHGASGDYRPIAITVALLAFALLAISAYGFEQRGRRGDGEAGLLGAAAVLLAGAQLSKLAMPIVPPDWVLPADALRVCAYGLLLVVSVRLYRRSHVEIARGALVEERRRIARDLHDGLAQDLAFISAHAERLAHEYGSEHPVAVAARRALAVSQGTIVDLEGSSAPSTEAALREVAAELQARLGVEVSVEADGSSAHHVSLGNRGDLVRIAREATVNAVRHGGARRVVVTLGAPASGLLLRVADDGRGIDASVPSPHRGTGLGMRAMGDRAHTLGGSLVTRSGALGGTEVDVVIAPGGRAATG